MCVNNTLEMTNSRFCILCTKMTHLEAPFDAFIKITRFHVEFLLIKKVNGGCNVRNMWWLLFGMSPDKPAFKVRVFRSDLRFWIGVDDISSRHLTQILLTLLTLNAPITCIEKYWFVVDVFSTWLSYYVIFLFTSWRVING